MKILWAEVRHICFYVKNWFFLNVPPATLSVCPWALLIVIANAVFRENCTRLNLNRKFVQKIGIRKIIFSFYYFSHNYCSYNISPRVCNLYVIACYWRNKITHKPDRNINFQPLTHGKALLKILKSRETLQDTMASVLFPWHCLPTTTTLS